MTKHILIVLFIMSTFQVSAAEESPTQFKTATDVIKALKASPGQTVEGPFKLTILSMSKSGFNTRLHTQKSPNSTDNIIIEIPPFMTNYYTKQFNTTLEEFFLNQTLSVNGKVTPVTVKTDEKEQTEYIIKIFLANQLAHLE